MNDERANRRSPLGGRDLARIGAECAESAFALLADGDVAMGEVEEAAGVALDAGLTCGVFFELEGCIDAVVALLFREGQRDALIERMMGESAKELGDLAAESVLTEVANIVASHVASGIADAHSDRLLPSLPTLAAADAAAQFETFLAQRDAAGETRYSCALDDAGRDVGALLVFVPRAASA